MIVCNEGLKDLPEVIRALESIFGQDRRSDSELRSGSGVITVGHYPFAIREFRDSDAFGHGAAVFGLQVVKSAPLEKYGNINREVEKAVGIRLHDLFTRKITMSNGSEGFEYGLLVAIGRDDYPVTVDTVCDAIRVFMINLNFSEIPPAETALDRPYRVEDFAVRAPETAEDKIRALAGEKPCERQRFNDMPKRGVKSLISRIMDRT